MVDLRRPALSDRVDEVLERVPVRIDHRWPVDVVLVDRCFGRVDDSDWFDCPAIDLDVPDDVVLEQHRREHVLGLVPGCPPSEHPVHVAADPPNEVEVVDRQAQDDGGETRRVELFADVVTGIRDAKGKLEGDVGE